MIYNFRYKSSITKPIKQVCMFIGNAAGVVICAWIAIIIMNIIGVAKYIGVNGEFNILVISFFGGILYASLNARGFKGVELYKDSMEIKTGTPFNLAFKKNIVIEYRHIVSVYNSNMDIRINKNLKRKYVSLYGDKTNYVEVTLSGGKIFAFSVEHQDEFIKDLMEKVNEYRVRVGVEPIEYTE